VFCDLHTHSVYSDGTFTPREIVDAAISKGLYAVALTDHNTVDGLTEFVAAAKGKSIDIVCGAEFSVDYEGTELHLLGLFIKDEYFPQISELMNDYVRRKEQSNVQLIEALNKHGVLLDYDEIKKSTPNGKINRAHIAEAITAKGYTKSIKEAFERFLSKSGGLYIEPKRISLWGMLDVIKEIDALSVLAHPFLNLKESALLKLLTQAKKLGLNGMECAYSLYDSKTYDISLKIAENFKLLKSGGSDFHGARKPDIDLGTGKGDLCIPHEWYLEMKYHI